VTAEQVRKVPAFDIRKGDRVLHSGRFLEVVYDARPLNRGRQVQILMHPAAGMTVDAHADVVVSLEPVEPRTPATPTPWEYDDGGRFDAGFTGTAPGDCATRAIAIATGIPYREVYDELFDRARTVLEATRPGTKLHATRSRGGLSPRDGARRSAYQPLLEARGWNWVPTMRIGSGTTVHLRADELPDDLGPLIVRVSKHVTALVDGVIRDTYDPSREGTRAVYGYFHN
jgi:hypothetical protein